MKTGPHTKVLTPWLNGYTNVELIEYILYFLTLLAIIVMVIICIRIFIPDFLFLASFLSSRHKGRFGRRFLGKYKYHKYYLTEQSLRTDEKAKEFASVLHGGYVNMWYDEYYSIVLEERLPLHIFVNWTRSIVEDLMESINPIHNVQGWDNYLHNIDSLDTILQTECILFEDYELAYLWGGVYYWLKRLTPNFDNERLLLKIEEVACRKKYLTPYFMMFKNMANGIEEDISINFTSSAKPSFEKQITSEQTALLWLAIAKQSEGEIKNKKKLAPVIHQLTGVGEKSLELKICGTFKDEDKNVLTTIVKDQLPHLADKIQNVEKCNPLPNN